MSLRRWAFRLSGLAALAAALLPLPAFAAALNLATDEAVTLERIGAASAYAVDADIVEASAVNGAVVLRGLRPGRTAVVIGYPDGGETMMVEVHQAPSPAAAGAQAPTAQAGRWSVRHDSASQRTEASVAAEWQSGERTTQLRVHAVRQPEDGSGRSVAVPSASLRIDTPERTVTLLDQYLEATPLTLDGHVVRGVHVESERLRLHAGVASSTPWSDLLLPESGDRMASASWTMGAGPLRVSPTLLWLPDSETRVPGAVSVAVAHGTPEDPFRMQAELGWSDAPAFSLDLAHEGGQHHAWMRMGHRPSGYAALDVSRPGGSWLDGLWSHQLAGGMTVDLSISASQVELPGRRPGAASVRADVRRPLGERWSVGGSVSTSRYEDGTGDPLQRHVAALAASYEAPGFGAAAQLRHERSEGVGGGTGGRLSVHAARGGWRGRAFVDAQQNAPTLELLLPPGSELARAFAELGFVATSPEDVLRLVREHAGLFEAHGVALGDLRVDPMRVHGGLDVAWQDPATRRQVGVRAVATDYRGVHDTRRNRSTSLYGVWPVGGSTELELALTRWEAAFGGTASEDDALVLTLRGGFSPPALPWDRAGMIEGTVHRAPPDGADLPSAPPAAGVLVVLDGIESTRTDADGRFRFRWPGQGVHQVVAVLPNEEGAYFTTASKRSLDRPGSIRFGIATAPARVAGRVLDDAGGAIAGVTVRISGAHAASTTTDTSGAFRLATLPGAVTVELVADSLPPGYDLLAIAPVQVEAAVDRPANVGFTVPAQRSLAGKVDCAPCDGVVVTELRSGTSVAPAEDGAFLLRELPAGEVTVVVRSPGGERRHTATLPRGPGQVRLDAAGPR